MQTFNLIPGESVVPQVQINPDIDRAGSLQAVSHAINGIALIGVGRSGTGDSREINLASV